MSEQVAPPSGTSEKKRGRFSVIFLICLIISTLLWLFVKLSREYTVSYEYHVTCCDVPSGKTIDQLSDSTLILSFKGKGFGFLAPQFLNKNRSVDISIKQLYKTKGSVETTQFTQNELTDYLKERGELSSSFVSVVEPSILFVYVK